MVLLVVILNLGLVLIFYYGWQTLHFLILGLTLIFCCRNLIWLIELENKISKGLELNI